MKDAGFGGVVYYDQNHRTKNQTGNKPDDGFSKEWWSHLKFAAQEAHKAGLSFELNISNGYVAGGKWIDSEHAMKRIASSSVKIEGGKPIKLPLPEIKGPDNYVKNISVFAFPVKDTIMMRHITARYPAKGKGRNGAMQGPLASENGEFTGYGFKSLPDIGALQVSDDSVNWSDVIRINPMYSSQGGYYYRTNSFKPTKGKYYRMYYYGDQKLHEWEVGPEAMTDRWEEKSGLHSDFFDDDNTFKYSLNEIVQLEDIKDVTDFVYNDTLNWDAPEGNWCILRLASVLTGAKSKHGRDNLLGYECDKLSREAATLHWNSYMQPILDSLQADGINFIEGVTMDSHEGGSQNWTNLMLEEFETRRGYSLRPWMPVLAGYIVKSKEETDRVLRDFRNTLNDCIRDNYYKCFEELAHKNNLKFTAQAIGNALCIMGDAVSVKKVVDKPQGEFWTYQQYGAYDIKDCSSAAHLYAKPVASAEAMTDALYSTKPSELKRIADIAFSFGAQEFVVCATPHIPYAVTSKPYVAGREYAINRSNPLWNKMKPMWQELSRSMMMLRRGKAAPDVLVFLGDDVPIKTLTNRLPEGLGNLDWDVCTGDALVNRISATSIGWLTTPDSVKYGSSAFLVGAVVLE